MRKPFALALVGLCVASVIAWQKFKSDRLTSSIQQVHARIVQSEAEQGELEIARQKLRDTEEKLSAQQNDLMKLRGQNTHLQQELATSENRFNAQDFPPVLASPAKSTEPSQVMVTPFTGTARLSLNPGETLVMGGWPTEDGKRTLALSTPTATSDGSVIIKSLYVQVPDSILLASGWNQYLSVTKDSSANGVFTPDQEQQFIEVLGNLDGVVISSSSTIVTASGQSASLSMVGSQQEGQTVTILPILSANNQNIDLTVSHYLQQATTSTSEQKNP